MHTYKRDSECYDLYIRVFSWIYYEYNRYGLLKNELVKNITFKYFIVDFVLRVVENIEFRKLT